MPVAVADLEAVAVIVAETVVAVAAMVAGTAVAVLAVIVAGTVAVLFDTEMEVGLVAEFVGMSSFVLVP